MAYADRLGATATMLESGELLVAGGLPGLYADCENNCPFTDLELSVEIYSPATGRWRVAAPMSIGRSGFTATRLQDGRVLAAGSVGRGCGTGCGLPAESSAELYDPLANRWTPAAPMHEARAGQAAALLPDGRVLVASGTGDTSVEIYDPSRDNWTKTAPMIHESDYAEAVSLPTGKVLVTGATQLDANTFGMGTELYDPQTGSWQDAGQPPYPGGTPFLVLLPSGRVMVSMHYTADPTEPLPVADIFDPATGTWTSTAPLPRSRIGPTATLLADGRVLAAGGWDYVWDGWSFAYTDLFDETTGTWQRGADLPNPRATPILVPLPDGTAFAIGGFDGCMQQNKQYLQIAWLPVDRFVPGAGAGH
jgi:hypothetical protein